MYILSEIVGQSCNNFFQYLYYLKLCIKSGKKLRIQVPDVTIADYPNLLKSEYISFPFYSPLLTSKFGVKTSLKITRFFSHYFLNNYVRCILHNLSFRKLNFLAGKPTWTGTDETYDDIRDKLVTLFELRSDLRSYVDAYFPTAEIICGVHMRGGDYRKWVGGKYFYEQTVYREAIDKFQNIFKDKHIKFLICTNEPIDQNVFSDVDYFTIPQSSASQDIYALTRCNYIIGTLSSFNAWASLLGNVPLYTMLEASDANKLSLYDFSPVVNYKQKANGWRFPRSTTYFAEVLHPWLYRYSNREHLLHLKYD